MSEAKVSVGGGHAREVRRQLIAFAWMVELIGVSCGVVNSAYTTFGTDFPTSFVGWSPAVPMAALASTELLRVPFAQVAATQRSVLGRLLAVFGLLAVSGLAVENWVFGFERIVSLRLGAVTEARIAQQSARAKYEAATATASNSDAANKALRSELEGRLQGRHDQIVSLQQSRATADTSHQSNLTAIRQTCIKTAKNDNCARDRSREEDQRYADEVRRVSNQIDATRQQIGTIQSELDQLTRTDKAAVDNVAGTITQLQSALNEAESALRSATEANQIYRLASMWFRVAPAELTEEQFSKARGFFSAFGAVVIAFAGSLAAFLGTQSDSERTAPERSSARVYRALRVLARKRKVRTIIQTVEKLVESIKYIDRVIYKHVPVDPLTGNVSPVSDANMQENSVPHLKVA